MNTQSPDLPLPPTAEAGPVHHPSFLHWIDYVPQQQRRLGLFICLALAVHFAAFFFIRIDTTRAEMQRSTRVHVTMENLGPALSHESIDAFWDELTDPRLFLLPIRPMAHLSSNEPSSSLSELDSSLGPVQFPAAAEPEDYALVQTVAPSVQQQVLDDMQPRRQSFAYEEKVPLPPPNTTWELDSNLAPRQPAIKPPLPSPVSDTDLNPTELRVAVGADGSVEHVLLENTCQKPELDQQAVLATRKLRFTAVDKPGLTWGRVTIFWHCTALPVEAVEPSAPVQ